MSSNEPQEDQGPADFADHEVKVVHQARLIEWLQTTKQKYFVGGDGHIGGLWNGSLFTFYFSGNGTVLQLRGQWHRVVAIERRPELVALFNARHTSTAWPKCFLMVLDDGSMRVAAEHSTAISRGLSDQQLDRAIRVGLMSGLRVFSELTARYPDPLASPPENLL